MATWGKSLADTRAYLSDSVNHIATGFPTLDAHLPRGGMRPGHMALVIARPAVGKSALGGQLLVNAATAGIPGLYISAEMVTAEVVTRMLSAHLGWPLAQVEQAILGTDMQPAMLKASEALRLVTILDRPEPGWDDIARVLNATTPRPRLVVLDHLQLLGVDKFVKGAERVATTSKKAKVFAKNHDVAVVLLHQVARGSVSNDGQQASSTVMTKNHGDQPLSQEDGFQAGEMDADYVLGLYRPELRPGQPSEFYEEWAGKMVIQLLKNRHGQPLPKGLVATWELPSMRITETMSMSDWQVVQDVARTLGG